MDEQKNNNAVPEENAPATPLAPDAVGEEVLSEETVAADTAETPPEEIQAAAEDAAAEAEETAAEAEEAVETEAAEAEEATEDAPQQGTIAKEAARLAAMAGGDAQPLDEATDEEEEAAYDEALCEMCQKNPKDIERDENALYCAECREAMLHEKLPWEAFIVAALCLVFAAASVVYMVLSAPTIGLTLKGDYYRFTKRYTDAYMAYTEAINKGSEVDDNYSKLLFAENEDDTDYTSLGMFLTGYQPNAKRLLAYANISASVDAGYYATQIYTESELKDLRLLRLRGYVKDYGQMEKAYDAVSAIFQNTEYTYQDQIAEVDKLIATGEHTEAYLVYYKSYMASEAGESEDQVKFLLQLEKIAPDQLWLYGTELIMHYEEQGDTEKVRTYSDRFIAANKNDTQAYLSKAKAYITDGAYDKALSVAEDAAVYNADSSVPTEIKTWAYLRQKDYDKAVELCEKGIETVADTAELYRLQSILYMLKGDFLTAFDAAANAYSIQNANESLTEETLYTLYLACGLFPKDVNQKEMMTHGYEETAHDHQADFYKEEIDEMLLSYSMEVPQQVQDCIAGKITPADIFLGEKGDVV